MAGFLSKFDQFPGCSKNNFIALLLPEVDVKRTIGKTRSTNRAFHFEFRGPIFLPSDMIGSLKRYRPRTRATNGGGAPYLRRILQSPRMKDNGRFLPWSSECAHRAQSKQIDIISCTAPESQMIDFQIRHKVHPYFRSGRAGKGDAKIILRKLDEFTAQGAAAGQSE